MLGAHVSHLEVSGQSSSPVSIPIHTQNFTPSPVPDIRLTHPFRLSSDTPPRPMLRLCDDNCLMPVSSPPRRRRLRFQGKVCWLLRQGLPWLEVPAVPPPAAAATGATASEQTGIFQLTPSRLT